MKLTVLSALFSLACATRSFSNSGNLQGWDSLNIEHNGKVLEADNLAYKGDSSIKVIQVYDPNGYTGRYHSEVVHNNGYKRGESAFYGFAFRLEQDWQFNPAQSYNLAQWIADFTDTGCDDWMPSSMIWILGDQLYTRVKQNTICDQKITTFPKLATVTAGEWHKVVVQATWKSDNTGVYRVWYDDKEVVNQSGIETTINDDREFSFRVGLYANGWHDDKQLKGSQGTRQIWHDQISKGQSYTDVDPAAWT